MVDKQILQIRRALEDRGFSLAEIARRRGVTRQCVSKVLRRPQESAPIRALIVEILGSDPWAKPQAKAG